MHARECDPVEVNVSLGHLWSVWYMCLKTEKLLFENNGRNTCR